MRHGIKSTVGIANVNYNDRDVIRVDDTFFKNRDFKLKDVISNSDKMIGFTVKFKQTSSESYGNESVMSIVVDY